VTNLQMPDRQSQFLFLVLMLLGTVLAAVGWCRWLTAVF
jgi:hypothetical protein